MHNRYCALSWQGSLVPAQQFWNETAIVYIARKLFLIPQDMIAFNQWPKLRVQVVSTLLPLDHMPKKQEGQDVGIVTSQESTKCCLRIPPNVLGFFLPFSHRNQLNFLLRWFHEMFKFHFFMILQVPEVTSIPHISSYSTVLGLVFFLVKFPTDWLQLII